jgi:hypothetical protein
MPHCHLVSLHCGAYSAIQAITSPLVYWGSPSGGNSGNLIGLTCTVVIPHPPRSRKDFVSSLATLATGPSQSNGASNDDLDFTT